MSLILINNIFPKIRFSFKKYTYFNFCHLVSYFFLLVCNVLQSQQQTILETDKQTTPITVKGSRDNVQSSEGRVDSLKIRSRPIASAGDVVETIPGVIATQHSGGGKANQYFIRGFSADHGTDFATSVNGVLINNASHAHGQGYNDLNFLIPELIQEIKFKKGVYSVENGDFSSAGSMDIQYFKSLKKGTIKSELGNFGYKRVLVMDSRKIGKGTLLYAVENSISNGPWTIPDHYNRLNTYLSYESGNEKYGYSIQIFGYRGGWHATNQIPERALNKNTIFLNPKFVPIGRFDTIDPTDGGTSRRVGISSEYHIISSKVERRFILYGIYYDMNLFSNFTYYMNDPINGDQIQQLDGRTILGGKGSYKIKSEFFGIPIENTLGVNLHKNSIRNSLGNTNSRLSLRIENSNRIFITNFSPYYENQIRWHEKIKTIIGVRSELYSFTVEDYLNSDRIKKNATLINPKGSVVLSFWRNTDIFLNAGLGFHSNDARGLLNSSKPVSPLVRTRGEELGIQSKSIPNSLISIAFWKLNLDSELVFSGDSGTTEPTRSSTRRGIEISHQTNILSNLVWEADYSISKSNYTQYNPSGDTVPQSARTIFSSGVIYEKGESMISIRYRHFGTRPLDESSSITTSPVSLWNFLFSKSFREEWILRLEIFNLLNTETSQIQYYYPTRLKYESVGSDEGGTLDRLFHPVTPRSYKFSLSKYF